MLRAQQLRLSVALQDYFEVVENPVKQAEHEKLLEWWNRYAHD